MSTEKSTSKRKARKSQQDPLEEHLRQIAKEAARRPLTESIGPESPFAELVGRFVEICLEEELGEHLGYARGERSEEGQRRSNTLGGYSAKTLKTTHSFWHQVLLDLEDRGLKDILVVTADRLQGLKEALETVCPRALILPCVVHLMREMLSHVSYDKRPEVARELKAIYQAATPEEAEAALEAV